MVSFLSLLPLLLILVSSEDYYGRCFTTASSWVRKDTSDSHHLEVYMKSVVDLDSGSTYTDFQANIDIESEDGSSLLVVELQSDELKRLQLLDKISGNPGLKKISASEGFNYNATFSPAQFRPMDEDSYESLLVSLLKNSTGVFFFGQVYHDSDGAVGIHDIHRITESGYGDGAFLSVDNQGNYYGIFAHFNDQKKVY